MELLNLTAPPRRAQRKGLMIGYFRTIASRRRDAETGASAVEYGLLVALIAAVIVVAVFALGGVVKGS